MEQPVVAVEFELVDTHCHLFMPPLQARAAQALARAARAGVRGVVVPSYDRDSWPIVAQLAKEHAGVYAAYGVHPWAAQRPFVPDQLRELLGWGRSAWVIAVGEVGLDFALPGCDRARQREVLAQQLDLALELDLPVILHCRKAADELEGLVRARPGLRGVVHGFSRGPELARRFVQLGLHVALGPLVTRPGAHRVRAAARELPAEWLVLETDAPSAGLFDVAAEQVEPFHVTRVAQTVAGLRGEPLEQLARRTTENARALFRLP